MVFKRHCSGSCSCDDSHDVVQLSAETRCSDLQGVIALFESLIMVSLDALKHNTNNITQLRCVSQARLDFV